MPSGERGRAVNLQNRSPNVLIDVLDVDILRVELRIRSKPDLVQTGMNVDRGRSKAVLQYAKARVENGDLRERAFRTNDELMRSFCACCLRTCFNDPHQSGPQNQCLVP